MNFELFCTVAGVILLVFMIPAFGRILAGPTALDRIVAANVVGTKTAVLLVIIGVIYKRAEMFVDFALAYALLNFVASVAAARFLHKTTECEVEAAAVARQRAAILAKDDTLQGN